MLPASTLGVSSGMASLSTSMNVNLGATPHAALHRWLLSIARSISTSQTSSTTPRYQEGKRNPNPNFLGPDIFQWGRGLPRERVGAKKFDTSLETREIKLFGRDIPGFCRDIPGAPEKLKRKKSLCSISVP